MNDRVRLAFSVGFVEYILYYKYACDRCKKTVYAHDARLHADGLGAPLGSLRFRFTARCAIHEDVLLLLDSMLTTTGASFTVSPSRENWNKKCCSKSELASARSHRRRC